MSQIDAVNSDVTLRAPMWLRHLRVHPEVPNLTYPHKLHEVPLKCGRNT